MKINHKKQEIINEFYTKIKKRFPEIEYKKILSNPNDKKHIWIIVEADMDDKRDELFREYEAEMEANIHLDYGYRISIMLENKRVLA